MRKQLTVNRLLLALAGAVLLGGGLLVLAAGLDLYRRWSLTPPSGWPLTGPQDVVLSRADRTQWPEQGWWWPTVIAVLAVTVLLALWWLVSQLRQRHPGRMRVGGPAGTEGVQLRDTVLNDAVTAEAGRLPDVHGARARLAGRSDHPQALITLTLAPDSAPGPVLDALARGPLEHARQSTGQRQLPSDVRLLVAHRGPHRVE
ncbi:alkaline shock response membrane anchor protein AmaP [Streptomyces sp. NPDC001922]|uniref:alkaline shock response membrane anchor protein AmaP n=1 Tax=Streptomyces sp. NPDC001922 TaxID=3364624 RepID=UPI003695DEF1